MLYYGLVVSATVGTQCYSFIEQLIIFCSYNGEQQQLVLSIIILSTHLFPFVISVLYSHTDMFQHFGHLQATFILHESSINYIFD
jgi:hypothetical protein